MSDNRTNFLDGCIPEDSVRVPGDRSQAITKATVELEQFGVGSQSEGDREVFDHGVALPFPLIFLAEVSNKEPAYHTDEATQHGQLRGQRTERSDQSHQDGPDDSCEQKPEAQQGGAPERRVLAQHGAQVRRQSRRNQTARLF